MQTIFLYYSLVSLSVCLLPASFPSTPGGLQEGELVVIAIHYSLFPPCVPQWTEPICENGIPVKTLLEPFCFRASKLEILGRVRPPWICSTSLPSESQFFEEFNIKQGGLALKCSFLNLKTNKQRPPKLNILTEKNPKKWIISSPLNRLLF